MLDHLECYGHDAKFNRTVFCAPEHWVRWNGGVGVCAAYIRGYKDGSDFFSVVWQINTPASEPDKREFSRRVRLQVESPSYEKDPELNDVKLALIHALLAADLPRLVRESRFGYEAGVRTSYAQVKKNKATTVFTVTLNGDQVKPTARQTIQVVHEAIGPAVNAIVEPFSTRLSARFGR